MKILKVSMYLCRIRTKKLGDSKVNTNNETISLLESYRTRYLYFTNNKNGGKITYGNIRIKY